MTFDIFESPTLQSPENTGDVRINIVNICAPPSNCSYLVVGEFLDSRAQVVVVSSMPFGTGDLVTALQLDGDLMGQQRSSGCLQVGTI